MNISFLSTSMLVFSILAPLSLSAKTNSLVTLGVSSASSTLGASVTLTATVSPASASGSVTFFDGVNLVGAKPLSGGTAVFSTITLGTGSHSLKAFYPGDTNFNSSSSAVVTQMVQSVPESAFGEPKTGVGRVNEALAADFNNDGALDLAIGFGVMLGDGAGGFNSVPYSGFTIQPASIATGDFNGDGIVDLVNLDYSALTVLQGKGDGTFVQQASRAHVSGSPSSIVVADFNGDGKADVVGSIAGFALTFFPGNGDGTFGAGSTQTGLPVSPASLFLGDFNGDGIADLVTVNQDTSVTVFLGHGDGTFGAPLYVVANSVAVGTAVKTVVAGDFNGDGKMDLAVARDQGLSVLLGNGDGTFTAGATYPVSWQQNAGLVATDLNGDGKPDLVAEAGSPTQVSLFLGGGDGTFLAVSPGISGGNTTAGQPLLVGDFNSDGRVDIVMSLSSQAFGYVGGAIGVFPGMVQNTNVMPLVQAPGGSGASGTSYFTGEVGMGFLVGSVPLTVKSVGRLVTAGNNQIHHVSISGSSTAQADVDTRGATPGTIVYAAIPPTVLQANSYYSIVSSEVQGGDLWGSLTNAGLTNAVFITQSIPGQSSPYLGASVSGPATFEYELSANFTAPAVQVPSISIAAPANNTSVSGLVSLSVNAKPTSGSSILNVQYQVGATLFPPVTTPPYSLTIDTTRLQNGPQQVTATVVDSGLNFASSSPVQITVNNAASTLTSLLFGFPATGLRNNFDGYVGMQFTVGSNQLQVSQLGRWVAQDNKQIHTIMIVDAKTGLPVPGASASLDLQGLTPSSYAYVSLSSPVSLFAQGTYYLLTQEFNGGDGWYDIGPVQSTGAATVNGGIYTNAAGQYTAVPMAGSAYVPASFLYNLGAGVEAPPTVNITAPAAGIVSGVVTATANATASPGLAIVSVQFQLNGKNIGPAITNAPYAAALDFTQVTTGAGLLTAIATDSAGDSTTSAGVQVTVSASTPFVTSFSAGPLRNNYSGYVGLQLTVGALPITVTQLARYAVAGNNQTHIVKLVALTAYSPVGYGDDVTGGSVAIPMAGATPGQFVYASLSAPVVLMPNTNYAVVSQETSGGDSWYDFGAVASTGIAAVTGPVYTDSNGYYQQPLLASDSYVPVNFQYVPTATVVITGPYCCGQLSGSVTVSAFATPGPGLTIASVQFQFNGANVGPKLTSAPYTFLLDTTTLPNGDGLLTAIATDSAGGMISSSAVPLEILNGPLPSLSWFSTQGNVTGTLRNNYNGFVGYQFTVPGAPIQVSRLGRYTVAGNNQTHLLKLVNADGSDVPGGSVTLSLSGAAPNQFNYASLASPITLQANTTYTMVSQEVSGGDQWFDLNSSNLYGSSNGAIYSDSSGRYVLVNGANTYGPVNFLYAGSPFITSVPTTTLRNNYSGYAGLQFTVGPNGLSVRQLGRFVAPGNSQSHILEIVDSSGRVLASASLSLSGATVGQYAYQALYQSVYLPGNQTYYLLSQEFAGGDEWYEYGPVTANSEATVNGPAYTDAAGNYVLVKIAGNSYVGVNLQ